MFVRQAPAPAGILLALSAFGAPPACRAAQPPQALPVRTDTVAGQVVDALTRRRLSGVRVRARATGEETTTGADGAFRLQISRSSRLDFSLPGYGGATRDAPGPLQARRLFVELRPLAFHLERLVVEAVRGTERAPVTATTLGRADLERAYAGDEVPAVLAVTPSATTFSDAGVPQGYSYLRLRGMDQTRIAMTLDGIPLNEPEDQGAYFSNVPDFTSSVESVQVQRGVGTSAFGTASYAGAVHFGSVAPAGRARGVEAQLGLGSYGTRRASVEVASGLLASGVAGYGRVSTHATDGYRRHSGSRSLSFHAAGGWLGRRDQLRLTAFGGRARNDMAYLAAAEDELRADPRHNPLGRDETDDFRQTTVALSWTRALRPALVWTTTAYRTDLRGSYDVRIDGLWNFNLASDWTGLASWVQWEWAGWRLDGGVHGSDYRRDHWLHVRPDLERSVYANAGLRDERSAFLRGSRALGRWTVTGDLQLRHSGFRYLPDPVAGAALGDVSWRFLNPRVGLGWDATRRLSLRAFWGRSSREPTRNDLFAGFDDVGAAEAEFLGGLAAVDPETVHDLEVGARLTGARWTLDANLYTMRFRNEIAPIGRLSYIGLPLRRNVARSVRSGLEVEGRWGGDADPLRGGANLALTRARIARYTDDATGRSFTDVPPLLTPALLGTSWLEARVRPGVVLGARVRFSGESHLANDGDARFVTPTWAMADLHATVALGAHEALVQLRNVTSATVYPSGYSDGERAWFYPVAPRNGSFTLRLRH